MGSMGRLHAGPARGGLQQPIRRLRGVRHVAVLGLAVGAFCLEGGHVAATGDALQGAFHGRFGPLVQAAWKEGSARCLEQRLPRRQGCESGMVVHCTAAFGIGNDLPGCLAVAVAHSFDMD